MRSIPQTWKTEKEQSIPMDWIYIQIKILNKSTKYNGYLMKPEGKMAKDFWVY